LVNIFVYWRVRNFTIFDVNCEIMNLNGYLAAVRSTYPKEGIFLHLYPIADNKKAPPTGEVARLLGIHIYATDR